MARPVLWHLELSHYNEKVRWALDLKRVPHVRRAPIPGPHALVALALTRQRRLPVLELDGRRIHDSTRIVAALEEHAPDPPLYPADAAERERALALEDFFDEQVGPALRSFAFHHAVGNPDFMVAATMPGTSGAPAAVMRVMFALAGPSIRADYRASPEAVDRVRAGMDRLEAELAGGDYLVGGRFTIADLAGAAMFTPVVSPPERPFSPRRLPPAVQALREELTARPGGRWIHEMYARHRRPGG